MPRAGGGHFANGSAGQDESSTAPLRCVANQDGIFLRVRTSRGAGNSPNPFLHDTLAAWYELDVSWTQLLLRLAGKRDLVKSTQILIRRAERAKRGSISFDPNKDITDWAYERFSFAIALPASLN